MHNMWSTKELEDAKNRLLHFIQHGNLEFVDVKEKSEFLSRIYTGWKFIGRGHGPNGHTYKNLIKWMSEVGGIRKFVSGQHKLMGRLPLRKAETRALLLAMLVNWDIGPGGIRDAIFGLPEKTLKDIADRLTEILFDNEEALTLPGDTKMSYPIYLLVPDAPDVWVEIMKSMSSGSPMCHMVQDQLGVFEGKVRFIPLSIISQKVLQWEWTANPGSGVYITIMIETTKGYERARLFVRSP